MNHVQTPVHIFPYNLKSKIKSKFDHIHCKCFCQSWIFFFYKHFNIYTGTYRWDSVAEVQIYETFGAKVVITNRKKDFNGRIWNQGKEMKERQLHKRNDLLINSFFQLKKMTKKLSPWFPKSANTGCPVTFLSANSSIVILLVFVNFPF